MIRCVQLLQYTCGAFDIPILSLPPDGAPLGCDLKDTVPSDPATCWISKRSDGAALLTALETCAPSQLQPADP
eukprot:4110589-Amphidinium_carterae.1